MAVQHLAVILTDNPSGYPHLQVIALERLLRNRSLNMHTMKLVNYARQIDEIIDAAT